MSRGHRHLLSLITLMLARPDACEASDRPFVFEENRGQAAPEVLFLARPTEGTVLLRRHGFEVLPVAREPRAIGSVTVDLDGARPEVVLEALDPLTGRVHYLRGRDRSQWVRNVPVSARVVARDMWPGIDVIYYGNGDRLEFDFVVAPGADPDDIALRFDGLPRIDASGDLVVDRPPGGPIRFSAPLSHQQRDGRSRPVDSRFAMRGDGTVGVTIGAYDRALALVIDPVLTYGTYFGGSSTESDGAVAIDETGAVFVTGRTQSTNLPGTMGHYQETNAGSSDAYVMKLSADGSTLQYVTYLGGSNAEYGYGIDIDPSGRAWLTGQTSSPDFPTVLAFQDTLAAAGSDAYVTLLSADGSDLVVSSFLGGTGQDAGTDIVADGASGAWFTGWAGGADFPVTTGSAFQEVWGGSVDAFAAKVTSSGSLQLPYATYLGGVGADRGYGIDVDASGNAYIGGGTNSQDFPTSLGAFDHTKDNIFDEEGFVVKLDGGGGRVYATFLGESDPNQTYNQDDTVWDVVADGSGGVWATGETSSPVFPVTGDALQPAVAGGVDAFLVQLNSAGSDMVYGTYLGGAALDEAIAVDRDSSGNVYAVGNTSSTDFPTLLPLEGTYDGATDAFAASFDPVTGTLRYSTYLGGSGGDFAQDVAVDDAGAAAVLGQTQGGMEVTTGPLYAGGIYDAFVFLVDHQSVIDDCNGNGVDDSIDISSGTSQDCNGNGMPDECDIAAGTSTDCDVNGVPDECDPDCNGNGTADACDINAGTSLDCNSNLVPDECELAGNDCNGNGIPDDCDIASGLAQDCNANDVPDSCDVVNGTSADCNTDGLPDDCQLAENDCNLNLVLDECEPLVVPRALAAGSPARVPNPTTGTEPTCHGGGALLSADASHVVYVTSARNIVPGKTSGAADVIGYDSASGALTRLDVSSEGAEADAGVIVASMSRDARYVCFTSNASNLVVGDENGTDCFVHDRDPDGNATFDEGNGLTVLASVNSSGQQADAMIFDAAISGDGHYVVLVSSASNLDGAPAVFANHIYVRDLQTGQTTRVVEFPIPVFEVYAVLSQTGRFVAFLADDCGLVSGDTNLFKDAFVADRDPDGNGAFDEGNTIVEAVSVRPDGTFSGAPVNPPGIAVSDEGRRVVFVSSANDLVPNDTNTGWDVFVRDRTVDTTLCATRTPSGDTGGSGFFNIDLRRVQSITPDGRYVTFSSGRADLVPGDTNGSDDVFLHDVLTGQTTLASPTHTGGFASGTSNQAVISADGATIAYTSDAADLVPVDPDGVADVFLASVQLATGAGVEHEPSALRAEAPTPNPFTRTTSVRLDLPRQSHVVLRVVDVAGREVARIVDGELPSGEHSLRWRPEPSVASGVYFLRLEAGSLRETRRIVLLR